MLLSTATKKSMQLKKLYLVNKECFKMAFPKITFSKIENNGIFTNDFSPFVSNNEIIFSHTGIAVLYGPNGTGKSSFAKVMKGEKGTSFSCEYNGVTYTDASQLFHVISDQNNRNIIKGETKDFLLGDDIKKEYNLEASINSLYKDIVEDLRISLKNEFLISSKSNPLINLISDGSLKSAVQDFINNQSKGKNISIDSFISMIKSLHNENLDANYDEEKWKFFISQYSIKDSLLNQILNLTQPNLVQVNNADKIEKDTVALDVLKKFPHIKTCIVCDSNDIDVETLSKTKEENRQRIIDSLTEQLKDVIQKIINLSESQDPFNIKDTVLSAINTGDFDIIASLQREISNYYKYFDIKIVSSILDNEKYPALINDYEEYMALISKELKVSDEDIVYLQEIVTNSMHKEISVVRTDNRHIKILLEDEEFIEKERLELPLSAGEQNFLSLSFELLKAKNSNKPIIVLDDPISSFDSIYKNKIIYSVIKSLEGKSRIILTHNTDMIRLLEGQYNHSYNLYILNNTPDENNGFIRVSQKEQKMLINIPELLNTFREEIYEHIENVEMFLLSMIPFMRGYASIKGDKDSVDELTELMHGYKTSSVDIVKIYLKLFGDKGKTCLPDKLIVNVDYLIEKSADTITIVNRQVYPTLDKTLHHSFTYLVLRLLVEKTLVEKFGINTDENNKLGAIIYKAFPRTDVDNMRKRIRLTSKKTLLNEFNHFEGNLSIFQPAIDITNKALSEEKAAIISLMDAIKGS